MFLSLAEWASDPSAARPVSGQLRNLRAVVGTQALLRTQRLHTPPVLRTCVLRVIPKFRRSARRAVGEVLTFTVWTISSSWDLRFKKTQTGSKKSNVPTKKKRRGV